jgi:hypothetical protein
MEKTHMRAMLECIIPIVALAAALTACSKTSSDARVPAAAQAGAPTAASGEPNIGGPFSVTLSGAMTGSENSRDAAYCRSKSGSIDAFSISLVDSKVALAVMSMRGLPAAKRYAIVTGIMDGFTVSLTDKTTGASPADWKQYDATSGALVFSEVSTQRIVGTFDLVAAPRTGGGATVNAKGTFEAIPAEHC